MLFQRAIEALSRATICSEKVMPLGAEHGKRDHTPEGRGGKGFGPATANGMQQNQAKRHTTKQSCTSAMYTTGINRTAIPLDVLCVLRGTEVGCTDLGPASTKMVKMLDFEP